MESKCVVRLETEAFKRGDKYYYCKTLRTVRLRTTFDVLQDECDAIGAIEAIESIVNLSECEDGLYMLGYTNLSRDYETNHIDGWDLKLFPYNENEDVQSKEESVFTFPVV